MLASLDRPSELLLGQVAQCGRFAFARDPEGCVARCVTHVPFGMREHQDAEIVADGVTDKNASRE
jgi:hypothetical protein